MILLDGDDLQPVKVDTDSGHGPTIRLPERVTLAERSSVTLPDYETSQALHIDFRKPSHRKRFAKQRFWKAVIIGMAIYVVVTTAIGVPLLVTKMRKSKQQQDFGPPWDVDDASPVNLAIKPGMFSSDSSTYPCDRWTPGPVNFSAIASHSLQPSGSLYFLSNVSFEVLEAQGITGNLTLDMNPDISVKVIQASVTMYTSNPSIAERTHVCFMDDNSNRGFRLYVPENLTSSESLNFTVDILLPHIPNMPLVNLYTTLAMFNQQFGDLSEYVLFKNVALQGSQTNITCDSIKASQVSITTSIGLISGNFWVTQGLSLDNIGGAILVNATVMHNSDRKSPTYFTLDTGNSDILANITLLGTKSSDGNALGFAGMAKNFNGTVDLNIGYHFASPPSPIDLHVQNSAGFSKVSLGPQFSGFFDAQTKMGKVQLVSKGINPSRLKCDQRSHARVRGWIGDSTRPKSYTPDVGRVDIMSSLSDVRLDFEAFDTGPDTVSLPPR